MDVENHLLSYRNKLKGEKKVPVVKRRSRDEKPKERHEPANESADSMNLYGFPEKYKHHLGGEGKGVENAYDQKSSFKEGPFSAAEVAYYEKFIEGIGLSEKEADELRRQRRDRLDFKDMVAYSGLHGEAKIYADSDTVKGLREKKGQMYKTVRSQMLEDIFQKTAKWDKEWLGGASVFPTLEYDDRVNHADFVFEWKADNGREPICLAVDVTVSGDERVLRDKTGKILSELAAGKLGRIDYFTSSVTKEKKSLSDVPRVILPFDKKDIDGLCEDINSGENGKGLSRIDNQLLILLLIDRQIGRQLAFVKKRNQNLAGHLSIVRDRIEEIIDKKSSLGSQDGMERARSKLKESAFGSN